MKHFHAGLRECSSTSGCAQDCGLEQSRHATSSWVSVLYLQHQAYNTLQGLCKDHTTHTRCTEQLQSAFPKCSMHTVYVISVLIESMKQPSTEEDAISANAIRAQTMPLKSNPHAHFMNRKTGRPGEGSSSMTLHPNSAQGVGDIIPASSPVAKERTSALVKGAGVAADCVFILSDSHRQKPETTKMQ